MMRPTRSKTDLKTAEMNKRDKAFQKEQAKEQEERASNTARLRALRLAKEAAEREQVESLATEQVAAKASAPAKKARLVKRTPATENRATGRPNATPLRT